MLTRFWFVRLRNEGKLLSSLPGCMACIVEIVVSGAEAPLESPKGKRGCLLLSGSSVPMQKKENEIH